VTASLIVAWYFPDQQRAEVVDFVTHEGEMSILIRETAAHMEIVDGGAALWRGVAGDFERLYLDERQKRIDLEELVGWTQKVTA
jgi:hypothetical protein